MAKHHSFIHFIHLLHSFIHSFIESVGTIKQKLSSILITIFLQIKRHSVRSVDCPQTPQSQQTPTQNIRCRQRMRSKKYISNNVRCDEAQNAKQNTEQNDQTTNIWDEIK